MAGRAARPRVRAQPAESRSLGARRDSGRHCLRSLLRRPACLPHRRDRTLTVVVAVALLACSPNPPTRPRRVATARSCSVASKARDAPSARRADVSDYFGRRLLGTSSRRLARQPPHACIGLGSRRPSEGERRALGRSDSAGDASGANGRSRPSGGQRHRCLRPHVRLRRRRDAPTRCGRRGFP